MAGFTVDIPALHGASAALHDVATKVGDVRGGQHLTNVGLAMPGSATMKAADAVAPEITTMLNTSERDVGATAAAIAVAAHTYKASDHFNGPGQPR